MFDLRSLISDTRFIPVSSLPLGLLFKNIALNGRVSEPPAGRVIRSADPSSNKITLAPGSVTYNSQPVYNTLFLTNHAPSALRAFEGGSKNSTTHRKE